jgi:hypothetical protein
MGQATVSAFITREEKIHLLNILGYDTSELQVMAKTSRRDKAQKMQMRDDAENGDSMEDDTKEEVADESVSKPED